MQTMETEALKAAIAANGADAMWSDRAIWMIEALEGSGIPPNSPTLLDDMRAAQSDHPKIAEFLVSIPSDDVHAATQLSYLTMQVNAAMLS